MGLAPLFSKQCSLRFSPSLGRQCLVAKADLWTSCAWRSFSAQPVPQEHGVSSGKTTHQLEYSQSHIASFEHKLRPTCHSHHQQAAGIWQSEERPLRWFALVRCITRWSPQGLCPCCVDAEAAASAPHALRQSELQAQESQYKRQQELSASRNLLDLLNAASQRAYGPLFTGNVRQPRAAPRPCPLRHTPAGLQHMLS